MNALYWEIIRAHCRPLQPIATGVVPRLRPLDAIGAVLFDVYGTLLISASGEVGTAEDVGRAEAAAQALSEVGLRLDGDPQQAADCLVREIEAAHQTSRRDGISYPEVDIVRIWEATIRQLVDQHLLPAAARQADLELLALHYEVRTNPTWPMPGMQSCLDRLRQIGFRLGIVSNAQFFTPQLFPALAGASVEQLGFDPDLQVYSYQLGWAKPSKRLFQQVADRLGSRGIPKDNVLYIGNDLLNDVTAASQVGFRTALFAGDARSLRLRQGDSRTDGVEPDLVVTELDQVVSCVDGPAAEIEG